MNYDRAIKTVRAVRGMSQQDLAGRMKVDEAFLSRLGKAGAVPSGKTLERVAGALEIPLYLLVLLASEENDLKTMSKEAADLLGRELLGMLIATEAQRKKPKRAVRSRR